MHAPVLSTVTLGRIPLLIVLIAREIEGYRAVDVVLTKRSCVIRVSACFNFGISVTAAINEHANVSCFYVLMPSLPRNYC